MCMLSPNMYFQLQQNQINLNTTNRLNYIINEDKNEASLISITNVNGSLFIPRSIIYDGKEFLVTKICECAFQGSASVPVVFDQNSQFQII